MTALNWFLNAMDILRKVTSENMWDNSEEYLKIQERKLAHNFSREQDYSFWNDFDPVYTYDLMRTLIFVLATKPSVGCQMGGNHL